jgi:hypothetical protein
MPKYASEYTGDKNLNFQNTFERGCDEIRLDRQSRKNIFGSLITTRLILYNASGVLKNVPFFIP